MIYNMKMGRLYFHFVDRSRGAYFYKVNADFGEPCKDTGTTKDIAEYYYYEDGKEEIIFNEKMRIFSDMKIEFIKATKILRENIK